MQQYGDIPYQAAVPVVLFLSFAVFRAFAFAPCRFRQGTMYAKPNWFPGGAQHPQDKRQNDLNCKLHQIASNCIKLHQIALIAKCYNQMQGVSEAGDKKHVWQVLGRQMQLEACEVWSALARLWPYVLQSFLAPGAGAPSMRGRHMLWK